MYPSKAAFFCRIVLCLSGGRKTANLPLKDPKDPAVLSQRSFAEAVFLGITDIFPLQEGLHGVVNLVGVVKTLL